MESWPERLPGARPVVYREHQGVRLRMHVVLPSEDAASAPLRPAVVWFFGGGWVGGTPEQFLPQSRELAAVGMVCACVEYRVRSRHDDDGYRVRHAVDDAQAAVRWLRRHAASYAVDAHRIAAGGGSAGGHLAACTAVAEADDQACRPDALLLFNPVLDTGPEGFGHDRPDLRPEPLALSPLHLLDGTLPPTLIQAGDADATTPVERMRLFRDAARERGHRVELVEYPGEGHGFFNWRDGATPSYRAATDELLGFLRRIGWLGAA